MDLIIKLGTLISLHGTIKGIVSSEAGVLSDYSLVRTYFILFVRRLDALSSSEGNSGFPNEVLLAWLICLIFLRCLIVKVRYKIQSLKCSKCKVKVY